MSTPAHAISLSSETVLSRHTSLLSSENSGATSFQNQVDNLVSGFVDQATDVKTLAAITAGGLAYRFGKIGVMKLGSSVVGGPWSMVRGPASVVFGLGSEVTAFEFTNRTLLSLSPHPSPLPEGEGARRAGEGSRALWSWNGSGGWKQSLISNVITFGALKGAGHLSRESNVILQHAFASTAMVAGHQASGRLGIIPRPEGSLAEQFLHAEAVNLQLGAGTRLVHVMAPRISSLERGLDLMLRVNVGAGFPRPGTETAPLQWEPQWALVGAGFKPAPTHEKKIHLLLMTSQGNPGGTRSDNLQRFIEQTHPSLERLMREFQDGKLQKRFDLFLNNFQDKKGDLSETDLRSMREEYTSFYYALFEKAGGEGWNEWAKQVDSKRLGETIRFVLKIAETLVDKEVSHEDFYFGVWGALALETLAFAKQSQKPFPDPAKLYRPGFTSLPFFSAIARSLASPQIPLHRIVRGIKKDYPWVNTGAPFPHRFPIPEHIEALARSILAEATPEERAGRAGSPFRKRQIAAAQTYLVARQFRFEMMPDMLLFEPTRKKFSHGLLIAWESSEGIPSTGWVGKIAEIQEGFVVLSDVKRRNSRGRIQSFSKEVVIERAENDTGKTLQVGDLVRYLPPIAGGSGEEGSLKIEIPAIRKQIKIGTDPNAEISLQDSDLLEFHCTIAPVGDSKWEIFNHSKQGMTVNAVPVGKWKAVEPGDEIVLFAPDGREIRRFRFGEGPTPVPSPRIEEFPLPPVITEQTKENYPLPFTLKKGNSYIIEGGVHWALMEDSPQGAHHIYIPDARLGPGHVEVVLNEDGTLTVFKRGVSKTAVWGEMGYVLLEGDSFNSFLLKPGERLDLGNNDLTDPTSLGLLLTLGENGQLSHRDPRLSKAQTLREIPAQADPDSVKKVHEARASSKEITVREGKTSFLIRPASPKERVSDQVGFGRIEQVTHDPHLEGLRVTFKIVWPYFNQDLGKFDQATEIKILFLSQKQAETLGVKPGDKPKVKFWIKKYKDEEEGGKAAHVERPDEAPPPTVLYRQGVFVHLQAKKQPPAQGIAGKVRFVQGNVVILTEVKRKNAQGEIESVPGDVMIENAQYFDEHDKTYRPLEEALRLGDRLYWNPPLDKK